MGTRRTLYEYKECNNIKIEQSSIKQASLANVQKIFLQKVGETQQGTAAESDLNRRFRERQ